MQLMETNNLTLEQQLILLLTKATTQTHGMEHLNPNKIGSIRFLAKTLSEGMEPKKVDTKESSYPPFTAAMSRKTIRILHYEGIDTPDQLAEHDFMNGHIQGLIPNIEILQYAMNACIKLKNYYY